MNTILSQWATLRETQTTITLYSFVNIFETIVRPYYTYDLLTPKDRMDIEMVLAESLSCECNITNECDDNNIRLFCHDIVFNILETNKKTPENLRKIIHQLNHSK